MTKATKERVWRAVGYSAFSTLATLLFLYWTFPWDAVRQQLELKIASALKASDGSTFQVEIGELHPSWLTGVTLKRFVISTPGSGPDATPEALVIPELSARVELWPLIRSRPAVDFSAKLAGGQLGGRVELGKTEAGVVLKMTGIDIGKARDLLGVGGKIIGADLDAVDLAGSLSADADLKMKGGDLTTLDGKLTVGLDKAMVKGGKVGEYDLPQVALGKLDLDMVSGSGKLDIKKFVIHGDDVEVTGDGCNLTLNRNFAFSAPHGKLKIHFGPDLLKRIPYLGMGLASLRAPDRDGTYTLPLSGTLRSPKFM
jgi:type II secretion system protein N